MKLDREELAWAAGLFDGEGGTYFLGGMDGHGSPKRVLRVQVSQLHPGVTYRFWHATGMIGAQPRKTLCDGNWNFRTDSFEKSQAIVAMLWFKLSRVKKDQAKESIAKYHTARVKQSRGGAACGARD